MFDLLVPCFLQGAKKRAAGPSEEHTAPRGIAAWPGAAMPVPVAHPTAARAQQKQNEVPRTILIFIRTSL